MALEVSAGTSADSAGAAPVDLAMATENRLWGEERIANELLVKLGVRISPRTVRKYMPKRPTGCPRGDQRWSTFLKTTPRPLSLVTSSWPSRRHFACSAYL